MQNRKEMYESGMSTTKISKILGITKRAVISSLKRLNVKMRTQKEINNIKIPIKEIIYDYKSGLSCVKLAKKYKYSITGISDLLKRNNIKILKPQDKTTYDWSFIYNDQDLFMYWLGWMLSDGCVHHKKFNGRNRGIMTYLIVQLKDKYILEFFRDKIDKFRHIATKGKNQNAVRIDISIPRMNAEYLETYGLIPAKSLIIKPTDNLKNLSKIDFMQMFVGLIEGDGDVRTQQIKNNKRIYTCPSIRLHSGSKEWLEFICDKLNQFGYGKRKVCGPMKHNTDFGGLYPEKRQYTSCFNYTISGKDAIKLKQEIMNCKYHLLDRKWDKISLS